MRLRPRHQVSDRILLKNPIHISIGLLAIAALAVLGLRISFVYISSPNLGGMETSIIYGLQRVLAGMPLYSDPESPPFAIIQYSPLYYQLVGTVGKWLGIDPDLPMQVYALSRWAGLVFNLLGLGVLANIVKGLKIENKWKWVVVLLAWLCLEPAHYARPDALQSLFFVLFIWAGLRYIQRESWAMLLWAVLAACLAVWSKQNGILLPLFLLFYLIIIKKNFIHALGAGGLLLVLHALLWLILVPEDSLFWANVIQGVDNGISPVFFFSAIYDAGVKKFSLFFIAGLYLAILWIFYPTGSQTRFLGWFLGASFAFATLTALKWGSIPSYYTDFIHLSLIASAHWLAAYMSEKEPKPSFPTSLFCALTLLVLIALHTSGKEWGRVIQEGKSDWVEQASHIRDKIQHQGLSPEKYIFTHDYLINLFLFKNCLFPQNDIVYCCTAPRETYDYARFGEVLEAGKISFVIDWKSENPRPFLEKEFNTYQPIKTIGNYKIWKHRNILKE